MNQGPTDYESAALATLLAGIAACATIDRGSGEVLSLDEGVQRIAEVIWNHLPEGRRIAALNFESSSEGFSAYVLEEIQGHLVAGGLYGGRFTITDRSEMVQVRKERDFQMSGEVSDESAVSIGKMLGADAVITGSFTDIGGAYRCRFNVIDVETAERLVSSAVTVRRQDPTVAFMLSESPPLAKTPARSNPPPAKPQVVEPPRIPPESAKYYFDRGLACLNNGDNDQAITDNTQAIRLKADYTDAYVNRGIAWRRKGDYDKAIADYTQAIRFNPNHALAYYNRGAVWKDKGDYDTAIADYTQAIRLKADYADAYGNRGLAYLNKGDNDTAIADCTQAIRLKADYVNAYVNRGLAWSRKGDNDKAIGDYTQAIRLNPNYALAYNNRGWAYRRARADYEKALQIDPNHTYARNNLETLRQKGY